MGFSLEEARRVSERSTLGGTVGLLPVDDRWFAIYFAQLPIASFDSHPLRVEARRKPQGFNVDEAGEGEVSPSPAPLPLDEKQKQPSGMCPV